MVCEAKGYLGAREHRLRNACRKPVRRTLREYERYSPAQRFATNRTHTCSRRRPHRSKNGAHIELVREVQREPGNP